MDSVVNLIKSCGISQREEVMRLVRDSGLYRKVLAFVCINGYIDYVEILVEEMMKKDKKLLLDTFCSAVLTCVCKTPSEYANATDVAHALLDKNVRLTESIEIRDKNILDLMKAYHGWP
jgi:predicted translin family RNA/ssDNA-binding protein